MTEVIAMAAGVWLLRQLMGILARLYWLREYEPYVYSQPRRALAMLIYLLG